MAVDTQAIRDRYRVSEVVSRYVPLVKKGSEFVGICPFHADTNPSLTVKDEKQLWKCFGCERGGDVIDFVSMFLGVEFLCAAEKITGGTMPAQTPIAYPPRKRAPDWIALPVPASAPAPRLEHSQYGPPVASWRYHDAASNYIGIVARYVDPDGKKDYRPYTWGHYTADEPAHWSAKTWPLPRPIYGAELLAQRPGKRVIVVEGEKAADAARLLFKSNVVVSWPGGADGCKHADWAQLAGRSVYLIPDNDDPGRKCMRTLADTLYEHGAADVTFVKSATITEEGADIDAPKGWDLADAEGWTPEIAVAWAKARLDPYPNPKAANAAMQQAAKRGDLSDSAGPHDINLPPIESYAQDGPRLTPSVDKPAKLNGHDVADSVAQAAGSAAGPTAASFGVIARRLSDVKFRAVKWLWRDRIACGKLTMIVGNPGLGKSQLTASITAIVTVGGRWPVTRDQAPLGSVIILSAEDDADDTIGPRLAAAGADLGKVHILDAIATVDAMGAHATRSFDLQQDVSRLAVLMRELGDCKLVIIDPISAYMGAADSHNNAEVRGVLSPITAAAADMGAAVVIINHLNKSTGQEALLRSQGSVGFTAAARAVWGVAKDKDNPARRLFMPLKNNLATDQTGLAYEIEGHTLNHAEGIQTSRVLWEPTAVDMSAEEVFGAAEPEEERGKLADAADFLRELLAAGAVKTGAIQIAARQAGHAWATVSRAKGKLRVIAKRAGGLSSAGVWCWELPGTKPAGPSYRDKD